MGNRTCSHFGFIGVINMATGSIEAEKVSITLLNLAKHQRLGKIEQLPVEVLSATWDDFQIITARCPVCSDEWEQMKAPWRNRNTRIFCRNCGNEIQPDARIA